MDVTDLTDRGMHERKWEVGGQFVFYGRGLPGMVVHFKADLRLRTITNTIATTRESLSGRQTSPSPSGIFVSVLPHSGDDEGDWDFERWQWVHSLSVNSASWYCITSNDSSDVQICGL